MPPATPVQAQAQPSASKAVAHQVANHAPLRIQRAPIKGEDLYPGNVADAEGKAAFLLGLLDGPKGFYKADPTDTRRKLQVPVINCLEAMRAFAKKEGVMIPRAGVGRKAKGRIDNVSDHRNFGSQQGIWNRKANFNKPGPWGRPDFNSLAAKHAACKPLVPKWRNNKKAKTCFQSLPTPTQWNELRKAGLLKGVGGKPSTPASNKQEALTKGATAGAAGGAATTPMAMAPWHQTDGWGKPEFKKLLSLEKNPASTATPFNACLKFAEAEAWYPNATKKKNGYTKEQAKTCWDSLGPEGQMNEILTTSSGPGYSRHHWGTDVDVVTTEGQRWENPEMKKTKDWLAANAARFGFYVTYDEAHTSLGGTREGYMDEAWHLTFLPLSQVYTKDYEALIIKNNSVIKKLIQVWQGHETTFAQPSSKDVTVKKTQTEILGNFKDTDTAQVKELLTKYALGLSSPTMLGRKIPMPPCALALPKGHPQKKGGIKTYEDLIQHYEDSINTTNKKILKHLLDFKATTGYLIEFLKLEGEVFAIMKQLEAATKEANMQGQIDF